jgi:hypothetical protein
MRKLFRTLSDKLSSDGDAIPEPDRDISLKEACTILVSSCGSQRDENGSKAFPDEAKFERTLRKAQKYSQGTFTAGLMSNDYPLGEKEFARWYNNAKTDREKAAVSVVYTHICGTRGREGEGSVVEEYTLPTSSDETLKPQTTSGSQK